MRAESLRASGKVVEGSMEELVRTMVEQQKTLEGIVSMQADLRNLVKSQHVILERKIACFGQPCGDIAPVPLEETSEVDGVNQENSATWERSSQERWERSSQMGLTFRSPKKKEERVHRSFEPLLKPPRSASEVRQAVRWVLLHPWFDSVLGVLILLNFLCIFLELEWKGSVIEQKLGLQSTQTGALWSETEPVAFSAIDQFFSALFVLELLGYLFTFGCQDCLKDRGRMLDILAIVLSAADSFVLDPILRNQETTSPFVRFIKVLRAFRLMRFFRVLRFMGVFVHLRVLVETLSKSLRSLIWSMTVVGFMILSSALFMSIVVQDILEDEFSTLSGDMKHFLYKYYGGALRCSYTMFEATFSAKWATHFTDELIWDVSPWFMVFWVFYIVTVNFAVIRVLSALFLKQTLDVAAIDAERVAAEKLKEKEKILDTLRRTFKMGDTDCDGLLTRLEFDDMMEREDIIEMFESLELDPPELSLLFNILAEDDGVADQEEFLAGALKLKTQVKTVDIVQLLHEQLVIKRYLTELAGGLTYMDRALHPRSPWIAKSIMEGEELRKHPPGSSPPPTQPPAATSEVAEKVSSEVEEGKN